MVTADLPIESFSEADLAREFNRRLLIARIRAIDTIEELAAPQPPAPPDDAANRRCAHAERVLRLRAAATLLRQKPIDLAEDPGEGADQLSSGRSRHAPPRAPTYALPDHRHARDDACRAGASQSTPGTTITADGGIQTPPSAPISRSRPPDST